MSAPLGLAAVPAILLLAARNSTINISSITRLVPKTLEDADLQKP